MIEYDFHQSVGYLVCGLSQSLQNALNDQLRRHGITFRQWQVLACLALSKEASQGDLAEQLGIEGATLVGVLDRMERDGWIRRHPCPLDRRKKIIRVTEQVAPIWATIVQCAHRVRHIATADISSEDLATTFRVLEKMWANLGAADGKDLPSLDTLTIPDTVANKVASAPTCASAGAAVR